MNLTERIKLISRNLNDSGIRSLWNYYSHWKDVNNHPLKKKAEFIVAQIEPTNRCNLSCPMCLHSIKKSQKMDMTLDQFKNILDQLPFLADLTLQGLGEPLLNPDLLQMIKEARKRKIRIGFFTNGTLLNKENASKIIESGLDWIYVSLDTTDKKTYEKIRKGASYEKVIENVKEFLNMKKPENKPKAGFWSLIMEDTVLDVSNIIDLAEKVKMEKIVFQSAVHSWGHNDFKTNIKKAKGDTDKNIEEVIDVIKNKPKKLEIEIDINSTMGQKCNWPWRALYITCDGYVTPCCMEGSDPNIVNFGNIFKTSLKEIVNNERFQRFRKELRSPNPPVICRSCPVYHQQKIIKI